MRGAARQRQAQAASHSRSRSRSQSQSTGGTGAQFANDTEAERRRTETGQHRHRQTRRIRQSGTRIVGQRHARTHKTHRNTDMEKETDTRRRGQACGVRSRSRGAAAVPPRTSSSHSRATGIEIFGEPKWDRTGVGEPTESSSHSAAVCNNVFVLVLLCIRMLKATYLQRNITASLVANASTMRKKRQVCECKSVQKHTIIVPSFS